MRSTPIILTLTFLLLTTTAIAIASTTASIDSDASGAFLVFWTDTTAGHEGLFATRVNNDDAIQRASSPIRTGVVSGVSSCWTGSRHLVTWNDARAGGLMYATVDASGAIIASPRLLPLEGQTFSNALAWNGSRVMLLYLSHTPGPIFYATLFDANGSPQTFDVPISDNLSSNFGHVTTIEHTFVAYWYGTVRPTPSSAATSALLAARFDETGHRIEAQPVVIAYADPAKFAATSGSNNDGVALIAATNVRRFVVDPLLQTSEQPPVNATTTEVAVSWNGSDFISYFVEPDSNSTRAVPFDPLSRQSRLVGMTTTPVVAWNGSRFLAAWTNGTDVLALPLAGDGLTPLTAPLDLTASIAGPPPKRRAVAH